VSIPDPPPIQDLAIQRDCGLYRLTTFRIGGRADVYRPATIKATERTLRHFAKEGIPYRVLGRGSNLLVEEGPHPPLLSLERLTAVDMERLDDSRFRVSVGAGCTLPFLLAWSARAGLTGLEPFAGIPASMGGAVAMNAGTRVRSIFDITESVLLTTSEGSAWVPAGDMKHGYRETGLPAGSVVSGIRILLTSGDREGILAAIKKVMERRVSTQPIGRPSAGCIFKNPPGGSAGWFIDQAGLKGTRVGGAEVSRRHGNFIVNQDGCTFADVMNLMELVHRKVHDEYGIQLEQEVEVWRAVS